MTDTNAKQDWLVNTFRALTERQGDELEGFYVNVMPDEIQELLSADDVPESLRTFYRETMTGEHFAFASLLMMGGAAIIGGILSAFVTSGITPIKHAAASLMPFEIPDPGSLGRLRMWTPDWTSTYNDYMAKHGFNLDRAGLMFDAARPRPSPGEIYAAHIHRYGAVPGEGSPAVGPGWLSEYFETYRDAAMSFPSLGDLSVMKARGVIDNRAWADMMNVLNVHRRYTQDVPDYLKTGLSPAEIMRYAILTGQDDTWTEAELHKVMFWEPHKEILEQLTYQWPNPLDFAHFLHRSGYQGSLPAETMRRLGFHPNHLAFLNEMRWSLPGPADITRYHHRIGTALDGFRSELQRVGFHPDYADLIDKLTYARPSPSELLTYYHRMGIVVPSIRNSLAKLEADPDYWAVHETLSHPMPGVADLVMMAVREVFSPEIAEAFGQFDEIPPEFYENAAKIGLTQEWARNYWGAHWNLPSPLQGFDMLHRGVIDMPELQRLFVALDIMPYWRSKMTDISYRVLTRVDVRRMYRVGVLNYAETVQAYKDMGYNDRDALRMGDFTIEYVRRQEVSFTRGTVLGAYRERMITREEAAAMLDELGLSEEDADFELERVDYDVEKDLLDQRIKVVEARYRKGFLTFDEAGLELDGLGVPPQQKTLLLAKWETAISIKLKTFSKSEVMRYYETGAIDWPFAEAELGRIGYTPERVTVMLSDPAIAARRIIGPRRQLSIDDMVSMLATGLITIEILYELLRHYGWRDPERLLWLHHLCRTAQIPLPEGIEPLDQQTILSGLLGS